MNAQEIDSKGRPRARRLSPAEGRLAPFAILIAAASFAADEPAPPPPPPSDDLTTKYVEIDQIAPEVSGSAVTVYLTGRAPKLPEGTVIEAQLTLYSAEVDKTTIKLDGSRRFMKFPFKVAKKVVFGDGYYLKLVVFFDDQTPKVQEELKTLAPRIFTGASSQWAWSYMEPSQLFRIGGAEHEKAQFKETQAFFKDLLLQSIKLNNEFAAAMTEVTEGKKYVTAGKFDSDAWRKWLDGTWRKSVLALQQKLQKWQEASVALASKHGEGVSAAWQLLEGIARRSFLESRALYRSHKLEIHENDSGVSDELIGLRVGPMKGTSSPSAIRKLREQLAEFYDKVIDSFGLDLTKVKKTPAPKKEAPKEAPPPEPAPEKKKAEAPAKKA